MSTFFLSFFIVVQPTYPLPTTASPTLQGALNDGFEEAVVAFGGARMACWLERRTLVQKGCKFEFRQEQRENFLLQS